MKLKGTEDATVVYISFGIVTVFLILLLIFIIMCFNSLSKKETSSQKFKDSNFIELENLSSDIYYDKYTDTLYYKNTYNMCPLMNADGTCQTFTEWKLKHNYKDN